jgi:acyl-CoA synthetase (NDP forming)
MKEFMQPKSVAVIGASGDQRKGGYNLVANLKDYTVDRLYPVNPRYEEVSGIPCFRSVHELPEPVDLAIIFIPASSVPEILNDCGTKGIHNVMIQSAGFAEIGEPGRLLQERCLVVAKKYGMRIWGPNCMGVVNAQSGMVASFMIHSIWRDRLRPGGVSLIVQSGMLSAGFLMQILSEGYFGLSKACSIGNRLDVNECDLLEYFAGDPATDVVALYLESVADVPRFRAAVSNLRRPVLLLKGGISPDGARAAKSHTASLAGDARMADGLFRQLGIHRAWDFMEWMDLTKALALWTEGAHARDLLADRYASDRRGPRRMAVVTFSGAAGIVAADHFARQGATLATLTPETIKRLKTIFPGWMEPGNPVDIWPAIELHGRQKPYKVSLEAFVQDPRVDGIFVHLYVDSSTPELGLDFLKPLEHSSKPAAIWLIGDTACFRALRDQAESMGIPVYGNIERGVRALCVIAKESVRPNDIFPLPAREPQ